MMILKFILLMTPILINNQKEYMTSEIRANTIKNRVGLGTVSYTNTGIVVSGIVTANNLRVMEVH